MPDKERIFHIPESLEKQGVSGQKGVNQNYDKSTIHLPWQHLNIRPEALIFLCFRGLKPIFTNDLPKLSD